MVYIFFLAGMALIVCLLFRRRPPAVTRLIVAIVANSINRVFRCRLFAHIQKEVLEGIEPAVTDRYSPPAIVFKLLKSWIQTAILHVPPRTELGAITHSMLALRNTTAAASSAARRIATPNAVEACNELFSAVTAHPVAIFSTFYRGSIQRKQQQAIGRFAGMIFMFRATLQTSTAFSTPARQMRKPCREGCATAAKDFIGLRFFNVRHYPQPVDYFAGMVGVFSHVKIVALSVRIFNQCRA